MHGFGQQISNFHIVVGRNRANVSHVLLLLLGNGLGHFLQEGFCRVDRSIDPATNRRRVTTSNDSANTFLENCSSQNGGGCCSVTGQIGSLLSDFRDQFGSHIFEAVFQFDFLGDRYTVFGNGRATERLVDNDVATGWAHRHGDGVSQFLDTFQHPLASVIVKD